MFYLCGGDNPFKNPYFNVFIVEVEKGVPCYFVIDIGIIKITRGASIILTAVVTLLLTANRYDLDEKLEIEEHIIFNRVVCFEH